MERSDRGALTGGDKEEIRRHMQLIRRNVAPEIARESGYLILRRFLDVFPVRPAPGESITLYSAVQGEPDLCAAAGMLFERGWSVALPRTEGEEIRFFSWRPGDVLSRGRMGIEEPAAGAAPVTAEKIRAMLIPGLAFSQEGDRIGFGKGYYDRYLRALPESARPLLVGTAYAFQVLPTLPSDSNDMAMNLVLTPENTFSAGIG